MVALPLDKINECMGDPEKDQDNPVLKNEQDSQVGLILVLPYLTAKFTT